MPLRSLGIATGAISLIAGVSLMAAAGVHRLLTQVVDAPAFLTILILTIGLTVAGVWICFGYIIRIIERIEKQSVTEPPSLTLGFFLCMLGAGLITGLLLLLAAPPSWGPAIIVASLVTAAASQWIGVWLAPHVGRWIGQKYKRIHHRHERQAMNQAIQQGKVPFDFEWSMHPRLRKVRRPRNKTSSKRPPGRSDKPFEPGH